MENADSHSGAAGLGNRYVLVAGPAFLGGQLRLSSTPTVGSKTRPSASGHQGLGSLLSLGGAGSPESAGPVFHDLLSLSPHTLLDIEAGVAEPYSSSLSTGPPRAPPPRLPCCSNLCPHCPCTA